jgi:hypothetical protein
MSNAKEEEEFMAHQCGPSYAPGPTLAHHSPYLGCYFEYGNETDTNVFGLIFYLKIMCT